ncbi:uncharacterized protein PHALS_07640 [Plasmopara halstedii]|uniref:Uncharacterized protein n=1 Tax=Plasmopara halstedii TaxID=4781 RepID=A0A0P1B6M2_PLAHL|nr:uncharacterized protein PHALS_07640 [Plasmopara halstedii]CEG49903.1 hypothetical protein PHALS_07640 [Plasmopara halstedii]|eukprot:XP_024586272.1 hypothetical protein PHALS_07640 [Plasmopara halstedii]
MHFVEREFKLERKVSCYSEGSSFRFLPYDDIFTDKSRSSVAMELEFIDDMSSQQLVMIIIPVSFIGVGTLVSFVAKGQKR